MTKNNRVNLQADIEKEGFDYAFRYYSHFKEIKDPVFHELRSIYIDITELFENYIEGSISKKDALKKLTALKGELNHA